MKQAKAGMNGMTPSSLFPEHGDRGATRHEPVRGGHGGGW